MKRLSMWTVLAATLLLVSCADKAAPKAEQPKAEQPKAEQPKADEASNTADDGDAAVDKAKAPKAEQPKADEAPAFDLAANVLEVEKFIPDSPVIVSAGDISALEKLVMETLGGNLFVLPDDKLQALQKTLTAYHLEKLGFSVAAVNNAVAFVGPTGDAGFFIKGEAQFSQVVYGDQVGGYQMLKLIPDPSVRLFEVPDYGVGIYVPAAVKLETYLQLVGERTEPKPERLKEFTDMLGSNPNAWYAVAINFAHPIVAAAWPPDLPIKRPDKGLIQFTTDGLVVEIQAQPEVLDSIDALVQMGFSRGRAMLDQAKAELDHMPVAEGTAIIVADAYYDVLFERLKPRRDGNRMRMELTLDVWGATPVIGILAAIAVPAFIKYMKRSKVSEASYNLDKIRAGAAAYFCSDRVDEEGNLLPKQFPPSAGPVPEQGCCAAFGGPDADGDDACDPDSARFGSETWQNLRFQLTEKHWFAYEFQSNGKVGNDAEYAAFAYADLDCDGDRSHFEIRGKGVVGEDGTCDVESHAIYIERELE